MITTKIPFRNYSLTVFTNDNQNATPILFLHGNSCSSKMWKQQFESTLGEKYYLLAFDFLGFGDSDHSDQPESDYSITALTEAVRTVIDHFQLKDYYLVGHSLGGHVIVQSLEHLQGCKGMISIAAPPISLPTVDQIYLQTAPANVMFKGEFTDEQLAGVAENFFYVNDIEPDFFRDDFRNADGRARDAIGAILGSTDFKDEVMTLNNTTLRKAFICGENERAVNNAYYDTLELPNTWQRKLHMIPETSHCPHWENAGEVNKIIDEFIQS